MSRGNVRPAVSAVPLVAVIVTSNAAEVSRRPNEVTPVCVPPLIVGDVIVLLVNVSVPASVASVPLVGSVTLVEPVVVRVSELAPLVMKAAASVKLPPSFTVRAALTMSIVSVRPAVKVVLDVAAIVTSNAADVSRMARPVKPVSLPPAIVGVLIAGLVSVLLVKVSVPVSDARVSVPVGNVIVLVLVPKRRV